MTRWAMAATLGALVLVPGHRARAADPTDRPDAQMLLDLDLLRNSDLAKSRDLYRRMNVVERMRMLELLQQLEADPQAMQGQPAPPARRPDSGGK